MLPPSGRAAKNPIPVTVAEPLSRTVRPAASTFGLKVNEFKLLIVTVG